MKRETTEIVIGEPMGEKRKMPERAPLEREKGRVKTKEGRDHYYL